MIYLSKLTGWVKSIWIGVLASSIALSSVDAKELRNAPLIGLPTRDPIQLNSADTRKEIDSELRERLPQLQGWPSFEKIKDQSAIAVSYDIHRHFGLLVGYWGGGWNYEDIEKARDAALMRCEGSCIIVYENGKSVNQDTLVAQLIEARKTATDAGNRAIADAEKTIIVDRGVNQIKTNTTKPRSSAAVLPDYQIGYPDGQQDYAQACQNRVFYALAPVPATERSRVLADLRLLAASGLYSPYQRSISTLLNYTQPAQDELATNMMRFSTEIRGDSSVTARLPSNLAGHFDGKSVTAIWLEGAVRVTDNGQPLVVDKDFRPLAIEVGEELYKGVEVRLPDPGFYCYVGKPFDNEVLRFVVKRDDQKRVTFVLNSLLDAFRSTFAQSPLSAVPSANERLHPGELALTRMSETSLVLGQPNYEKSTYFLEVDIADSPLPFYSLYNRQNFRGGKSSSIFGSGVTTSVELRAFLRLTHSFTRSKHRLGDYRDPSTPEVDAYAKVIKNNSLQAITSACTKLQGRMDSNICIVK